MTLREEWLTKAKDLIVEQVFTPHELRFPPLVKVSVGMCPGKSIGFCCNPRFSEDGSTNIFITPEHGNAHTMDILSTLTHELCHAWCYGEGYEDAGHGHPFTDVIRQVGLEGPPKKCGAREGTELYATLQGIQASLGDYPHAPQRKKEAKKRLSEILTWVSTTDPEYTVKAKYSMTEEKGTPRDHNGEPMEVKDKEKLAELQDRSAEDIEEQEAAALPE